MSHTIPLWCGCRAHVSCHPDTGIAFSRILEARGSACPFERHDVGVRLWLWEMLPEPRTASAWKFEQSGESAHCVLRAVGDRVELHISMSDEVVMSQQCRDREEASAVARAWWSALMNRGWVEQAPDVTLRPKPDRRSTARALMRRPTL